MPTKIEQSELRENIERMILEGVSYAKIVEWAKEHGLEISTMTVKRHKESYNLIPASNVHAGLSISDIEQITNESVLNIDVPEISNGDDAVKFARQTAQRIYCNQLAIVEAKQKLYMSGEGQYPHVEIMGLKNVLSVLGYMSDDKDKAIAGTQKDLSQ